LDCTEKAELEPLYKPLERTRRQVRVLRLETSETDHISCSLQHADLDDANLRYNALSYAWGTDEEPNIILVNEQEVEVHANLYAFLKVMKSKHSHCVLPLWVDRLCINQGDISEKNWQVAMMADIYSGAAETFIWLGPDSCGLALPVIKRAFDIWGEYCQQDISTAEMQVDRFWDTELTDDKRNAYGAFSTLPYWERHWVAQEIGLSGPKRLLHGEHELEYTKLAVLVREDAFPLDWIGDWLRPMTLLFSFEDELHCNRDEPQLWVTAARFASTSTCADLRDKVFGMQSMFSSRLRIPVDYTCPVRDVYLAAVHQAFKVFNAKKANIYLLEGVVGLGIGMRVAAGTSSDWGKLHTQLRESYDKHLRLGRGISWKHMKSLILKHVLMPLSST
jgi:hypothetical protein